MTQTEIIDEITSAALGRVGAGDSPSAADTALAETALTRIIDGMEAAGEVWFGSDNIASEIRLLLVPLVTAEIADGFGVEEAQTRRVLGEATAARRKLISLGRTKAGGPVPFTNY